MKRILLIDDEGDFCHFVKANLELTGQYKVMSAPDGKQGLKAARKYQPDVILLDIMMPQMDGFEVLRRLKKDQKTMGLSVIMLTARNDDASQLESSGLYCEDYLVKPVEVGIIKSTIEDVLARKFGHRTGL